MGKVRGEVALANVGPGAGAFPFPSSVTIDAQGRVTAVGGDFTASPITFSATVTLGAGALLSAAAGAGGLSLGSATGNSTLPTGSLLWSGAAGKNCALLANANTTLELRGGTGAGATKIWDGSNASAIFDEVVGVQLAYSTSSMTFNASNFQIAIAGTGGFIPSTDKGARIGTSAFRWSNVWSMTHNGAVEVIAAAGATPNFDATTNGEVKDITLSVNITGWTLTAGNPGQIMTLVFRQPAAFKTIAGKPANALLAGGAFALTGVNNAVDILTLRYDSTLVAWVEVGRAANVS